MGTDGTPYIFRITGPPQVLDRRTGHAVDLPVGKPLAALAYITLEGSRVTRNDLATLLWPASPPERARASVRQALWLLRKQIHPDAVVEDAHGVLSADESILSTDLEAFQNLLATPTLESLAEAWNRWNGGLLVGMAIADAPAWQQWADELRTRWERHLGEALEGAAERTLGEDRLRWLERALEVRPFREVLHEARARALLELGRLDAAEAAVRQYRHVVDEPDPDRLRALDEELAGRRRRVLEEPEGRLRTEFVGRSEAFSSLRTQWQSTLSGRPRTVALVGPTGIGKSRLASEFLARAQGEGAAVVEAKAMDVERALELGTLAALVRDLMALPGAAGVSVGSEEALGMLVPSRRRTQGLSGTGTASPAALVDALVDLLEAVAHEAPLVVLLEDTHWADPPSRAVFLRAGRALRGSRVMIIWTCRSDTEDRSVVRTLRAAEEAGHAQLLTLDPLTASEVAELLALLVTSGTEGVDALAPRLHRASGGNPLHVMELLQSLRSDGVLRFEAGSGWVLDGGALPDTLALPISVRQALERRLAHLSDPARRLARYLAASTEPLPASRLLDQAASGEPAGAEALTELLQGDIFRWTRDGLLAFAHDTMRDTVLRWERGGGKDALPGARRRRWWLAAAAVAGLTLAGLGWFAGAGRPGADAAPIEGVLWAQAADWLYRLEPDGLAWRLVDSLALPASVGDVFPLVDARGEAQLFTTLRTPGQGPDVVRVADGRLDTLLAGPGDEGILNISPDGRSLLIAVEDTAHPTWLVEVQRLDLATGQRHLIHRPSHQTWGRAWHPDGSPIAVGISEPGQPDSVLLYDPLGRRVGGFPAPPGRLQRLEACGPHMLVGTQLPGEPLSVWRMDYQGGMEPMPALDERLLRGSSNCDPGGRFLAYLSRDGGPELSVVPVDGGPALPVQAPPLPGVLRLRWTPSAPRTLPVALDLPDDTVRVAWGEGAELRAMARFSDDSQGTVAVRWESREPGIVGLRDGKVVGNAPGVATVVGTLRGWLRDSVTVRVEGDPPDEALWAERFEALDSTVWSHLGLPSPAGTARRLEGEPVLELLGDGVWIDGIFSHPVVELSQGATVELEFRMPLSRTDRQQVRLCLTSSDPPDDLARAVGWNAPPGDTQVCATYPGDELSRFDPSAVRLNVNDVELGSIPLPHVLPGSGWQHLGLQMGADGSVALVLNRRVVHTVRPEFRVSPERPLRIVLTGRAVDTELLVRNLIVWRGMRYREGAPGSPAPVSTPDFPPGSDAGGLPRP